MSVWAPTKVINDGLIFYYDIGNSKSFAGEPTTNHYSNSDLASGNNVGQEGGSNPTNDVIVFSNPGNSPYCVRSTAVGGSIYTEYQLTVYNTISANTDYTLSCWVAWTPDWDGTYSVFHMRWYNSSGGQAGASGLEQGTTLETRVVNGLTWYRKYYSFNSGASVNGTHDWYVGYYSNNTKGYRYFTNFQLEPKNHATQWSSSTRSNTQGLLDLSLSKQTISLLSAGFNSSADLIFTATNSNFVSAGTGFANFTSGITCEFWAKFTSSSYTWERLIDFGTGQAANNIICSRYANSNSLWFELYNGAGSSIMGFQATDAITNGSVAYYAFTANGTTATIYKNGLPHTTTVTSALPTNTTRTQCWIGRSNWAADSYFQGTIPVTRMYNRSLAASEILQNFNATKGRFGL